MKSFTYLLLLGMFLYACSSKKEVAPVETFSDEKTATLSAQQWKNAGILTDTLVNRTVPLVLKVNGIIDVPPQNKVSISVPLGGYIKSTQLLPGMKVEKGEVLAVIEDHQYVQLKQDYLTAKTKLKLLKTENDRQKELSKDQSVSDKVVQQYETDYQSTKILFNALAEKLSFAGVDLSRLNENNITSTIQLIAPISGYISKVNVHTGMYVAPTDILFEILNPSNVHLMFKVFEKDLSALQIGQEVIAFTNNMPDKKYKLNISLTGKSFANEGYAEVYAKFQQPESSMVPGTYMNAEVYVQKPLVFSLPEEAIVRFENKHYIFVQTDTTSFKMEEVQPGDAFGEFTAILNGSAFSGKKIAVKGAYTLLMFLKNNEGD